MVLLKFEFISASSLHRWLLSGEEVALIDVREQGVFGQGHLLVASNLPIGELEVRVLALIPRLSVPVVICDSGDGVALAARSTMLRGGYSDVRVLEGGVTAWKSAGYELFSGVNVPSKVFGEYVEHRFGTPRIEASVLQERIDAGENFVILDSRPVDEFVVMSIPGGVDVPGAELVYRVADLAPASTTIIVNCAGRTRSIIGCQSLLNAGVSNPVMALKDGTMGWHLAGFELARGALAQLGPVSAAAHDWSSEAADRVASRFGVDSISYEEFMQWQAEAEQKTLYVFDVRQPDEFAEACLPGSSLVPGGQLVQGADVFVAVRAARIVLVDDTGVRAKMTASWLNQMGFTNVAVLDGGIAENRVVRPNPVGPTLIDVPEVAVMTANELASAADVGVIDIRKSLLYRAAHIPGACWGSRSSFNDWAHKVPVASHYVVVCDQDDLASFFADELSCQVGKPVSRLIDGMRSWTTAGLDTQTGMSQPLTDTSDVFHRPYDRESGRRAAMQAYLDWEVALLEQVKRDATVRFPHYD